MSGTNEGRSGRRRRRRRGGKSESRREENLPEIRRQDKAGSRVPAKTKARADRLGWVPPPLCTDPIPELDCAYCGKPIKDMDVAIQDKISNGPVHFDCVIERLSGAEKLDMGDALSYIGGGRFAVVHFGGQEHFQAARSIGRAPARASRQPRDSLRDAADRVFLIKKVFEWEDKEHRPDWRLSIADHYSST